MITITRACMVFLLIAALFVGCRPQGVEKLPDNVSVQLKWIHQAQFAGFYVADRKRFYADQNIDVTFNAGGPGLPPATIIADLVDGRADLAIISGDQFLAARSRGEPIVAIAVVFQKNPYVYVTRKTSEILRPRDLVGKKVMVPSDAQIQHQAFLRKLGIDADAIEQIPYQRDVTPLCTGRIDAHLVYRTGLGLAFNEKEYELNWMWLYDYGIRFYADTIVTNENLIRKNPDLVLRFLKASLKGWRYAIQNMAEAVDLTLQYDPDLTRDLQARMLEAQTPLIHTGSVSIGWMEKSMWEGMYQTLLEADVVVQPFNPNEAYTMQFLNKIYGKEK